MWRMIELPLFFFQAEDGIRDYKVTGVKYCFFFKAEDGIRDYKVTGVQTCALPISRAGPPGEGRRRRLHRRRGDVPDGDEARFPAGRPRPAPTGPPGDLPTADRDRRRSEERRVGKECRSRWSPDH